MQDTAEAVRHLRITADPDNVVNTIGVVGLRMLADRTGLPRLAQDPQQAIRQALAAWIDSTASAALELVERRGRLATHLSPDKPGGFPGWHAILGGITGWSVEGTSDKQQWFTDASPWAALAPLITPALNREHLHGVRLFVGQGGEYTNCEVRINGRLDEPASAALARLDWPRSPRMSVARTFLLLVHPTEAETPPPTG